MLQNSFNRVEVDKAVPEEVFEAAERLVLFRSPARKNGNPPKPLPDTPGWAAFIRAALWACYRVDRVSTLRLLLDRCGSALVRELARCADTGRGVQCLAELEARGASVVAADGRGVTALMTACIEGRAAAAAWLLERGAPVNAAEDASAGLYGTGGFTALIYACRPQQSRACVELLLRWGADPDQRDSLGRPPLHHACFVYEPKASIVRLLLDHGARSCRATGPPGGTTAPLSLYEDRSVLQVLAWGLTWHWTEGGGGPAGAETADGFLARLLMRLSEGKQAEAAQDAADVQAALLAAVQRGRTVAARLLCAHVCTAAGPGGAAAADSAAPPRCWRPARPALTCSVPSPRRRHRPASRIGSLSTPPRRTPPSSPPASTN